MHGYALLAPYYDDIQGDVSDSFVGWIRQEIAGSAVNSVLELGCGTGSVLASLSKEWRRVGVDASSEMLNIAKRRDSRAEYILCDFTSLSLDERFDLVICIYDTMNHLTDPVSWGRTFAVAARHLNPGGLFLFDIHTERGLRDLANSGVHRYPTDRGHLDLEIHERGGGQFDWLMVLFEEGRSHEATISELTLPLSAVVSQLSESGFRVAAMRAGRDSTATEVSPRAYFVCRLESNAI